jgi:glycosyltransferase involved in cell wall biosynthesis
MIRKVAIVCGAGIVSGKEVMALTLGEGLCERGVDVRYATAWWGNGEFRKRMEQLDLKYEVMPLGFISATMTWPAVRMTLHQFIYLPHLFIQYARFVRRFKPDKIVHTNWHHLLLLLPLLDRERDIFWVHEIVPDNSKVRWVFRAIDKRIKSFVAVSGATADRLKQVGVRASKISLVYNGVEEPRVPKHGSEGDGPVAIGIVGQVGAWKGHGDLIDAFARAAISSPGMHLHIFGKGPDEYETGMRRRIKNAGLESRVKWHGFVADRDAIYRQVDVCVVPSRGNDPLPTSAIEAGMHGIPVIASRSGGLPEVVEHGMNGFLFDVGDVPALADHLVTLVSNPSLLRSMGERARARAKEKFGRSRFLDDFLTILNQT